ncbi:MAG: UvrD-helicase domain-containing protein [Oligoflexales bacterium]
MKVNNEKKNVAIKILKSLDSIHLINSGAGVGKTTFVVYLITKIFERSSNSEILVLSFSRNARFELEKRVCESSNIKIRTFHSFYLSIIQKNIGNKVPRKSANKVGYSSLKISEGIKLIVDDSEIIKYLKDNKIISCNKTIKIFLEQYKRISWRRITNTDFRDLLKKYAKRKKQDNKIDLYEIEVIGYSLLRKYPHLVHSYDYIIVDEAQDSKSINIQTLRLLIDQDTKLILAGDEYQNIYEFIGTPKSISKVVAAKLKTFKSHYLPTSFRLTKRLANLANSISKHCKSIEHKKIKANSSKKKGKKPKLVKSLGWEAIDYSVKKIKCGLKRGRYYGDYVYLFPIFKHRRFRKYKSRILKKLDKNNIHYYLKEDEDHRLEQINLFYTIFHFNKQDKDTLELSNN